MLRKFKENRRGGGGSAAIHFMGQGDKAARACTSTAVLVPRQRIVDFGRHSNPPGCSDNRRGRTRVCDAHAHHHWPPREVQVTALEIPLGARHEPCRTSGGAAGVDCSSTGGCGGIGAGGQATAGVAVAAALGAVVALAAAGARAAECPAVAAPAEVGCAAVADGAGRRGAWVPWRVELTAEAGIG